jgi:hypothetical protein
MEFSGTGQQSLFAVFEVPHIQPDFPGPRGQIHEFAAVGTKLGHHRVTDAGELAWLSRSSSLVSLDSN